MKLKELIEKLQEIEQKITGNGENKVVFGVEDGNMLYVKLFDSSDPGVATMIDEYPLGDNLI